MNNVVLYDKCLIIDYTLVLIDRHNKLLITIRFDRFYAPKGLIVIAKLCYTS